MLHTNGYSVTSSSAIIVDCSYSAMLAMGIIFFVDACFLVLVYIECFRFGVVVLKGTIVVTLRSFLAWGCSGWGLLSSSSVSATSLDMYGASRSDLYCGVPSDVPIEVYSIDDCNENQYPQLLAL